MKNLDHRYLEIDSRRSNAGVWDQYLFKEHIPIVFQNGNDYLVRRFYQKPGAFSYYIVLDWEKSLEQPAEPKEGSTVTARGVACVNWKLMTRLNHFYPDPHILNLPDFLQKNDEFYLFDDRAMDPITEAIPRSAYSFERVSVALPPSIASYFSPIYLVKKNGSARAQEETAPGTVTTSGSATE